MGNMQLLSSLLVFVSIISVVFYSLPPVSARSQFNQLQIHPDYDCDIQNSAKTHSACLKENKKASKDLNSTVSSPLWVIDLEEYKNFYKSKPSSLSHLTFEKIKSPVRLRSFPFTVLADLHETHQNWFRPAPETNQKQSNCDCYQISAQPRLSLSFSASLETLQKHLNYKFQNDVLLRRAMTHSSYSLENNKEFSILGERLIETTVALRSLTEDIDIPLGDLNDKISEISDVDTSCAADGMRLGLQDLVRVSSRTDSSTSSIVCDAFRAMLWTIALDSGKCDDAHNVFWAVHGGDGKAI